MKLRGWLLMVLFAHVMLHPWVHAIDMNKAGSPQTTISSHSPGSDSAQAAGDQCELCRAGHNATAASHLPNAELLNPRWIHTALQAVNYASLQTGRRLRSRAPPIS